MRMDDPKKNVWRNHQRPKPSDGWAPLVLQTEGKTDGGVEVLVVTTRFIFSCIFRLTAASAADGTPLHTSGVSPLLECSVILILTRIDCSDLLQAALLDISGCLVGVIAQVKTSTCIFAEQGCRRSS